MDDVTRLIEKLCDASRKQYVNPYEYLEWPERADPDAWYTSPELISIYHTEAYQRLSEPQRKRVSLLEAVNFFSLNIHGEKSLVEGLAHRLYRPEHGTTSPYLHHFLDEENKHMVYFGGFCQRYAGKVYPDRKMSVPREYAPGEEDLLFFAKVMIFEEVVDVYNQRMADDARVAPVARQINLIHHRDEARHLVFGREMVAHLFKQHAPSWTPATVQGVRDYLGSYFIATWKEYYNPDVYQDAGLPDPYGLHQSAFADERSRAHRRDISGKCVKYLIDHGLLTEEPAL